MIENTLYYKDNYLKEFETVVLDSIEENGKIKLILKNTAFYPEGGGQPADTGFIGDVKVLDVQEKNNIIYHFVDKAIPKGTKVKCKINFENRFSNMQSHTAEHIVSGIICSKFKATNVGFHIGKDFVTMDFNYNISKDELLEVEKIANDAVYKNIEVKCQVYEKEEVKNINYRSKKELDEDIRLVEVPGYDICACCGIHVKNTGEIGIIKLLKAEKYKTGTRIYMLAGSKALNDYTEKYNQVNNISSLLSLKLDEVYDGVERLTKEIEDLKKEKSNLKNQLIKQEISNITSDKNIILEKDDLDGKDMKRYCEMLKEKASNISGIISNKKFILMSDSTDLKEVFNIIKQNIDVHRTEEIVH